jgi:hypothetical protein
MDGERNAFELAPISGASAKAAKVRRGPPRRRGGVGGEGARDRSPDVKFFRKVFAKNRTRAIPSLDGPTGAAQDAEKEGKLRRLAFWFGATL